MIEPYRLWHNITLFSHIGLLVTIIIWYLFLSPPQYVLSVIFTVGYILILLIPAPGLLKRTPTVYMWSGYLILIYFIHGIIEAWANVNTYEKLLASIEIVFSVVFFISALKCFRLTRHSSK